MKGSMLPLRILCLMSTLDRGGAESMAMELFRNIDRSHIVFDFVKHTDAKGAYESEIKSLGGVIYSAPRYKVINHIKYVDWWKRFFEKHPEYRIVHCHFSKMCSIIAPVAHKANRIIISHSHFNKPSEEESNITIKRLISNFLLRRIEPSSDYCFACSQTSGEWLYKKKDFNVLKNALDTRVFKYDSQVRSEIRSELDLDSEFIVGTVANFSAVKNPMGLIDIFLMLKKIKPDTKLLWVGDGNLRPAIEKRILAEGVETSVILLGTRDDVPRLLQGIDAFLLPSFNEGLPVSAIEAQAAGLPCFISDRVTKEVDITGLCHFLPIDQPDLWVWEILNDQTPRTDTSDKIIAAGYDIQTTAKWLEEYYLNLV